MSVIFSSFAYLSPDADLHTNESVHTMDYDRSASPFLFTTLIAFSARFTSSPLYPALYAYAKKLGSVAMEDGTCDVATIQAFSLHIFWKVPDDKAMWLKLGHTIRLAYELEMHKPRKGRLPDNEYEARVILVSIADSTYKR